MTPLSTRVFVLLHSSLQSGCRTANVQRKQQRQVDRLRSVTEKQMARLAQQRAKAADVVPHSHSRTLSPAPQTRPGQLSPIVAGLSVADVEEDAPVIPRPFGYIKPAANQVVKCEVASAQVGVHGGVVYWCAWQPAGGGGGAGGYE